MKSIPVKFERLDEPNIYGYGFEREDGLQVEVVQCYEHQWNVFITRPDPDPLKPRVVARSVEEYRMAGDGYVSRMEAFRIARSLSTTGAR